MHKAQRPLNTEWPLQQCAIQGATQCGFSQTCGSHWATPLFLWLFFFLFFNFRLMFVNKQAFWISLPSKMLSHLFKLLNPMFISDFVPLSKRNILSFYSGILCFLLTESSWTMYPQISTLRNEVWNLLFYAAALWCVQQLPLIYWHSWSICSTAYK